MGAWFGCGEGLAKAATDVPTIVEDVTPNMSRSSASERLSPDIRDCDSGRTTLVPITESDLRRYDLVNPYREHYGY